LKKGNYQIVHTHLPVAAWLGIVGKIFCRKKQNLFIPSTTLLPFYSKIQLLFRRSCISFFRQCNIYLRRSGRSDKKTAKKANGFIM